MLIDVVCQVEAAQVGTGDLGLRVVRCLDYQSLKHYGRRVSLLYPVGYSTRQGPSRCFFDSLTTRWLSLK